ncbi:uncharacterized protein Nmag_0519 [Natrialba magadii ATCC 43099]|uniref:Uncharacterized protein n=1 Tax=Natrialba magadii (strain ATCC 43099 / DSM 3394 / CCM 3739 / CIP 104546 / IAM 13178 / JCM 8861 / NBRC 102185 / NCIMB 2190 / MS3) TaxID=547559 RepID=D3SYJ5_NATMM|nr:uncharacterized protein Nmag_0519 [Natrialba magadii ATCC 43099]ELY33263.1 hypothetical protein C500_03004 [Natrialba magadii ATCC 43099]
MPLVNVFWLDEDPRLAARYHCDQHVNKLLLEAAQVLCTAARENGYEAEFLYQPTHVSHPVTEWATESRANWLRLREHAEALNAEFTERYEKDEDETHASWEVIDQIDPDLIDFPSAEPTPRPQAMPDEYRCPDDPVAAYRAYYAGEKAEFATWEYTEEPPWLAEYLVETV